MPTRSKDATARQQQQPQKQADKIPLQLKPLEFPVAKLKQDPANARLHSERNLEAVKQSLDRFGFRGLVVARQRDKVVIAGNARLEAAKQLGWKTVPVLFVPDDHKLAKSYAIADNRSGELAAWDWERLAADLAELGDAGIDVIGFDDSDISSLLDQIKVSDGQAGIDKSAIEEYDAAADTKSIKVDGIPQKEGQRVANLVQRALQKEGLDLKVVLY